MGIMEETRSFLVEQSSIPSVAHWDSYLIGSWKPSDHHAANIAWAGKFALTTSAGMCTCGGYGISVCF